MTGNHAFTHTVSWLLFSSLSTNISGFSDMCFAQDLIMRIASMLVSGKAELDENSDKHFTASWKESMVAEKCSLKM